MTTTHSLARIPAVAVCVVALLLTAAGCGGSDDSSQGTPSGDDAAESTGASTPGEAECTFDGKLPGKASVKEAGDAYEVVFSGQPVHRRSRSIYAMSVSGDEFKPVSLQIRFDEGKLSGYGVVDDTAQLTAVPGRPTVSGSTVSGTFPKDTKGLRGMAVTQWAPDVTFLDSAGEQGQCKAGAMQKLES